MCGQTICFNLLSNFVSSAANHHMHQHLQSCCFLPTKPLMQQSHNAWAWRNPQETPETSFFTICWQISSTVWRTPFHVSSRSINLSIQSRNSRSWSKEVNSQGLQVNMVGFFFISLRTQSQGPENTSRVGTLNSPNPAFIWDPPPMPKCLS